MASKSNQSKKTSKAEQRYPHYSVYLTESEKAKVLKAAKKQHRTVASYIASVLLPQVEEDLKEARQ